jgi:ribosomal protein S18 acetylase RimI-like enzyme
LTFTPPFVSEALTDNHDLTVFDCQNGELNDWLRDSALHARDMGTARTYVWVQESSQIVAAYYSVAPHLVVRETLSKSVGSGSPDQIPAVILARLAIHHTLKGQRLGSQLLLDALELIVAHAREVGGRLVVVDAIDQNAIDFYRHHGFQSIPGNDKRLVQKLSRVAATLNLPWP